MKNAVQDRVARLHLDGAFGLAVARLAARTATEATAAAVGLADFDFVAAERSTAFVDPLDGTLAAFARGLHGVGRESRECEQT